MDIAFNGPGISVLISDFKNAFLHFLMYSPLQHDEELDSLLSLQAFPTFGNDSYKDGGRETSELFTGAFPNHLCLVSTMLLIMNQSFAPSSPASISQVHRWW